MKNINNCLPACYKCNRLRWHRSGKEIRDLLLFGLVIKDEIKKKNDIGKTIKFLKDKKGSKKQ